MKIRCRSIPIEEIDLEDQTFIISFGYDLAPLKASIDLLGIINPPTLRQKATKCYQVVTGYKRLLCAKELGFVKVACMVLPPLTDDLCALMIVLHENICGRGLNLVEKARLVLKFLDYLPEEEVLKGILPTMGLKPHPRNLELLKAVAFLESPLKEALIKGRLNEHLVFDLLELPEDDRARVFELFEGLSLSYSRQREALEMLKELSRLEERSLTEILDHPEIKRIFTADISPKDRTERFILWLKRRRYPRLSELEERFMDFCRRLKSPGVRIKPPPAFETEECTLSLSFRDMKDLETKWQQFAKCLKANQESR
ncbi:ParB/RepB/Spo0J family partition protein [Thermosulfuriphilus sp.]